MGSDRLTQRRWKVLQEVANVIGAAPGKDLSIDTATRLPTDSSKLQYLWTQIGLSKEQTDDEVDKVYVWLRRYRQLLEMLTPQMKLLEPHTDGAVERLEWSDEFMQYAETVDPAVVCAHLQEIDAENEAGFSKAKQQARVS